MGLEVVVLGDLKFFARSPMMVMPEDSEDLGHSCMAYMKWRKTAYGSPGAKKRPPHVAGQCSRRGLVKEMALEFGVLYEPTPSSSTDTQETVDFDPPAQGTDNATEVQSGVVDCGRQGKRVRGKGVRGKRAHGHQQP